mmetsp:Transcript_25958/g.71552  ORF Transcript_25958/g.71552 Transcript_25958/m.71552 type:complete len:103 (-) Transcript_25958:1654-1962(-)
MSWHSWRAASKSPRSGYYSLRASDLVRKGLSLSPCSTCQCQKFYNRVITVAIGLVHLLIDIDAWHPCRSISNRGLCYRITAVFLMNKILPLPACDPRSDVTS